MGLSRRLVDFFNGFIYGMGAGVFAFGVGFLLGKITILGHSIAWMAP
jgi:hypothetical protein|tara:strand:+ start:118 stop:258 length:141 start_codon:yes stop_codon:yes gene_type:complete